MPVAEELVEQACSAFAVATKRAIGDFGQKSVSVVEVLALDSPTLSASEDEPPELMVAERVPGSRLVLKVIQLGGTSPQALQRARREVQLLHQINSPHVVRAESELVVLGDPPAAAAWLEELLPGQDLQDELDAAWDARRTAQLMEQVSLGVAQLHNSNVVHRDLSPKNVRVATADRFVVIDPGYARHELLPTITVGVHPGTPGFMSPEHLQAPPSGPTRFSDVFCIGVLGHLVLYGQQPIPYVGDLDDYFRRLRAVDRQTPTSSATMGNRDLVTIIDLCLHPQPARRYKHAADVASAVRSIQWDGS